MNRSRAAWSSQAFASAVRDSTTTVACGPTRSSAAASSSRACSGDVAARRPEPRRDQRNRFGSSARCARPPSTTISRSLSAAREKRSTSHSPDKPPPKTNTRLSPILTPSIRPSRTSTPVVRVSRSLGTVGELHLQGDPGPSCNDAPASAWKRSVHPLALRPRPLRPVGARVLEVVGEFRGGLRRGRWRGGRGARVRDGSGVRSGGTARRGSGDPPWRCSLLHWVACRST